MAGRPKGPNKYRVEGGVAYIELTQGREAMIDVDDVGRVLSHRWFLIRTTSKRNSRCYATSRERGTGKTIYLHRFVSGAEPGVYVDHINGDGLDNRKSNLRFATNQQNAQNKPHLDSRSTTGIRGVSIHKGTEGRLYYVAKVSVTRYFPHTEEGFEQAARESERLRSILKAEGLA